MGVSNLSASPKVERMDRHAVIIGGGIGGLATGQALRASGWTIEIHERASGLPTAGTALGMWPVAIDALDRLGVGHQVRQVSQAQRGGALLRPDGRPFASVGRNQTVHLISRPNLHRILYDGLSDAITWNAEITELEKFADADLIVGADGINSIVRERVAGSLVEPRPLGSVAFRGVVSGPVDTVTETWGPGRLFGITPHDSDCTNWFACVRQERVAEVDRGQPTDALLRDLYHGWHPAILGVLDRISPAEVDRRTLYDVAPLASYVRGNVAVLGDAAHAMAPNLGRGACESLLDAVALADAMEDAATVESGLEKFDRLRRHAANRIVRGSRLMNRLSTTAHLTRARNAVLGVLSRFA